MEATYKDIQRLTGFSLSTISKYFNGGNLRPRTKEAIETAVADLNFRVNDLARGLKSRKSMSVGLLIPELNSVFHTTIMRHVGHILRMRGYSCIVCDSNMDKKTERDAVQFLVDKMVEGIITIPLDGSGAQLELAKRWEIPCVLIDRKLTNFVTDAVIIDNFYAGKAAAEYLLSKGHRNAAVVSGPLGIYTMGERFRGFENEFSSHGAKTTLAGIETEFSIKGGYNAALDFFKKENEATAVFCTNYELTLGTIMALNELGLKFPDDVSVFGFDNMELSAVIKPSLTVIEQPMEQMSRLAAELLLRRLESEKIEGHETIVLGTKMIEGSSVAKIN
ncbi:MAG: LacI family transcriptional regulator [Clostridiales bacterium]|jgi:LacI family transcriptional regulator|nr:LacI family transcriptional regulator [Clostridiales bacterium]